MPVHVELTLEEETELMQEIVANGFASGPEVAELEEAENDEAAAEEPTPSVVSAGYLNGLNLT